jgi:predicted ATPase
VLAERFPQIGELSPELVAHHYSEANLAAEAIPYWRRAAENAVRRSAYREATAHFERGLELIAALPDTPERDRQELGLLVGLGPVLFATRGFAAPEVDRAYARARQLSDRLGEVPEAFPTLWGQWGVLILRGNVDQAREIGEQLLRLARSSADPALLLQARHALWPTRVYGGELGAAVEDVTEGLALYDLDRHRSLAFTFGGHDAQVCGLAFNTFALGLLGRFREALASGRRTLEAARVLAHPHSEANGHAWVSLAYAVLGDIELARAEAEAGLAVSTEHGFPQWAAASAVARGATLAASGEIDAGIIEMRRGLADWRATGAGVMIPVYLGFIAASELARGDIAIALRLIDEASQRIEVHGERMYEAEIHRLRGEALLAGARPDPAHAESCFRRAIAVAGAQRARCLELRATTSLASLWQRQGRRDDAHRMLTESARWFADDIETSWLREARRLLRELA